MTVKTRAVTRFLALNPSLNRNMMCCSEMLLRQLVLLLAAVPNPTHAPVCSSPLLLTEFESTAVVSKRQEDQQVPVWPVPRPRPRRVRGGPVAAREDRLPSSSQQEDRATWQVSSV